MPLPPKDYFGLDEIEGRWEIERRDTVYFVENELLEVSVHVIDIVIESGLVEDPADDHLIAIPEERGAYTGLLPLRPVDVVEILRRGSTRVRRFRSAYDAYCVVASPDKAIMVRAVDLVVSHPERDRFEHAHRLGPVGNAKTRVRQEAPRGFKAVQPEQRLRRGLPQRPYLSARQVSGGGRPDSA